MKLILKESQLSLSEGSVVNILGLVGLTLEMFPKSISSLQIVLEAGKVPMLHLSSYVPDFEIQEDPVQAAYDAAIKAVAQTITRSELLPKKRHDTIFGFYSKSRSIGPCTRAGPTSVSGTLG